MSGRSNNVTMPAVPASATQPPHHRRRRSPLAKDASDRCGVVTPTFSPVFLPCSRMGRSASLYACVALLLLTAAAVARAAPAPVPAPAVSTASLPAEAYLNSAGLPLLMPTNRSTDGRSWYFEIPPDPGGCWVGWRMTVLHVQLGVPAKCHRLPDPPLRSLLLHVSRHPGDAAPLRAQRRGLLAALSGLPAVHWCVCGGQPAGRRHRLASVRCCLHHASPPVLHCFALRKFPSLYTYNYVHLAMLCRHARGRVHRQAGAGAGLRPAGHQLCRPQGGARYTLLEVRARRAGCSGCTVKRVAPDCAG